MKSPGQIEYETWQFYAVPYYQQSEESMRTWNDLFDNEKEIWEKIGKKLSISYRKRDRRKK